jgi:hypothetical protein
MCLSGFGLIPKRPGTRRARTRHYRGIFDHIAVGVNSLARRGPGRMMLRKACGKKEIILFDYAVPFGKAAAYILGIPPLIDTQGRDDDFIDWFARSRL